jgi:hypothetical protein
MRSASALRGPSRQRNTWSSPRNILAVGAALVAIGIGQALTHHSSPAAPSAPTSSAVGRWEVGLLHARLLAADGSLRSRGTAVVELTMTLKGHAIQRAHVQVAAGSVVEAQGTARAGASATVGAVRITLTAAGRALLLGRALDHTTALRLSASLSGSGGGATHSVTVTLHS